MCVEQHECDRVFFFYHKLTRVVRELKYRNRQYTRSTDMTPKRGGDAAESSGMEHKNVTSGPVTFK